MKESNKMGVLISALLVGFGWHIRGSGTSDPTVVILLFLLFFTVEFYPNEKNNYTFLGIAIFVFRMLRTGWGTFVSQSGFPWGITGQLYSTEITQWWQGYFWLFIVGLSWSWIFAMLMGGYYFGENKRKNIENVVIVIILFIPGVILGQFIAKALIPIISPEAFNAYLTGQDLDARNYNSMVKNLSFIFAIIPGFCMVLIKNRDWAFIKRSITIMIIFGVGLSIADIWQAYGRYVSKINFNFWAMWEYTSGFIIGALLYLFYYCIPEKTWEKVDENPLFTSTIDNKYPKLKKFIDYFFGHFWFILYGLQESIVGMIISIARVMESEIEIGSIYGVAIIIIIDLPLYFLAKKGKIGGKFAQKPFNEKALIYLIILVPIFYLCLAIQYMIAGTFFPPEIATIDLWTTTVSVLIVEFYFVYRYNKMSQATISSKEVLN